MWEVWLWAALCSGIVLSAPHLGESTELAWLLVHEAPQQSPLVLRRITPKSVFLAPTFTSCSEGYRQDAMGRCVKEVKLNQQAQWEFLLQKLNSMYAAPEPSRRGSSGPIRLNIPIEEEEEEVVPSSTTTEEPSTTGLSTLAETTDQPFLIVVANSTESLSPTEGTTTTEVGSTVLELTEEPSSTTEPDPTTVTEQTTPAASYLSQITVRFPGSEPEVSRRQSALERLESSTPPPPLASQPDMLRFPEPEVSKRQSVQSTTPSSRPLHTVAVPYPQPPQSPRPDMVRFPDTRNRPSSSYVRFPSDAYPYWWPHNWDRTQVRLYI